MTVRRPFTVAGFIVGPRLPSRPVTIGNVRIERVAPDILKTLPRGRPRTTVKWTETMFSGTPGEVHVESPWIVRAFVQAVPTDEAQVLGRTKIDSVVTALNIESDGLAYRVEMVRVIDNDGDSWSTWSPLAVFAAYDVEEMTPARAAILPALVDLIDCDEVARTAGARLRDGCISATSPLRA